MPRPYGWFNSSSRFGDERFGGGIGFVEVDQPDPGVNVYGALTGNYQVPATGIYGATEPNIPSGMNASIAIAKAQPWFPWAIFGGVGLLLLLVRRR